MRHFLATLEYDGTGFSGWQVQPGQRTVQGELEKSLREIAGRDIPLMGAGRTDGGVHAAGQAASFSLPAWKRGTAVLATALNAKLPFDLAVRDIRPVPAGFNARRDAVSRHYRYAFLCSPVRAPLLERWAYRIEKRPDYPAMQRVASLFRGRHDFSAFARESDGFGPAIRKVTRCSVSRSSRYILMDVEAGGFLRHMVRHMAAAVLGAGLGTIGIGAVRNALKLPDSRPPGGMLPAYGVALMGIRFRGGRKTVRNDSGWPPGQVK